ncbi:hypothetical protein N7520_003973 [Penicillium odoratum]|uniref:uncharacterized protein n=1 Tax=Penicillium odoratum TaxID=1167516 RepID=UPI0025467D28|nr:uncharacterized protein N7520_003973 [Penicillium odoratum]KAJ5769414.1 hypothetical protein N7520_003973 [Penicillium odoratum]
MNMKLTTIIFFLTATAWCEPQKRDATSAGSFNFASLSNAIVNLAAATTTGNFANISPPPKAFMHEILAVIPLPVVGELMDAQSRSSLASQLQAGTTPTWYASLPTDAKNYVSAVRLQIQNGAVTATTGVGTGAAVAAGTATATAAMTSTSSGMAAQATAFSAMIGALGVLGLALAL